MATRDTRTRERLLDEAARLFAQHGLKRVTVRSICRAARANVAAVNYHFGNKADLYAQVMRRAIDVLRETTKLSRQAADGLAPEDQLKAYIRIMAERVINPPASDAWIHPFIMREMADPSPALTALVDRGLRPRIEFLCDIVGAMLQLPSSDARVQYAVASIQAQILSFRPNPLAERVQRSMKMAPLSVERVVEHVTAFSVAGVRGLSGDRHGSTG
jgi:AcrR family transcriptional regulator